MHQRGIKAVLLEEDRAPGGTWRRRYDRLHLHTVRGFSGLAHYSIPHRYPQYLSREEFAEYLGEYSRHFDLRIETECTVRKIQPTLESPVSWAVLTSRGNWSTRCVIVATGQYRIPMLPAWPGREIYQGEFVHSVHYRKAAAYAGKRVLVVGAGNSGAEIATDLAEGGANVALSIRTQPPIVPRDPFGFPVQRTGILLSLLPSLVSDRLARLTARLVLGDLSRYGLRVPEWMPYSSKRVPVIDVGFVEALKRGLVHIRPALARLTATDAVFEDGRAEPFDAVIAATGFTCGLNDLVDAKDVLKNDNEPIGLSGLPTARPGLFFMGYTHSLRGHLFEANLASRRLARHVERYLSGA